MPSFPTSVFAPATKTTGQTIQAAHVNDVQDEIVAIEGGYLNGTARINSSNSTVANLSVSGGSTFTGAVVVASTSAIACRVVSTVVLQLANATWTAFNFEQQVFNQNSMHSTATNSSRITFQTAGVYLVGGNALWSVGSTAGVRGLQVLVNDATEIGVTRSGPTRDSASQQVLQVVTLYQATAGQHATLRAYQDSGSTHSVAVESQYSPVFWATKVGV